MGLERGDSMYEVNFRESFLVDFEQCSPEVQKEAYNHILDLQQTPQPHASYPVMPQAETFRYVYILNQRMMYFIDEPQQLIEMLTLKPW